MKVSESIKNLKPYKPGKPIEETKRQYGLDYVVKLASNESPIGVSEKVKQAIIAASSDVHRYPDPGCHDLTMKVSEYFKVKPEHLAFGNGSNELIDLLIKIYCEPGEIVLTSQAAFIAYKVCSHANRASIQEVELTADLKINVDALVAEAKKVKPRIVFIPNPNNPTGTYLNAKEVDQILTELSGLTETLIVFDEAYNEFVRAEDYPQLSQKFEEYNNVAILKTFSKVFGLAGLRVGALIAPTHVIDLINKVRNPFNVNHLAQVGTIAALEDHDYLKKAQQVNWQGLDYFYDELGKMNLKYWPSQANFVLFDTEKDSEIVFEELLKLGVILRPVKGYGLLTHLRMSVGLPEENKQAIVALKKVLKR